MYNSVLAFISLGAKVDESVTGGPRPDSFRIQGELYHKIGSLCPVEGQRPQFAQPYIHDTKCEHQNRHVVMPSLDPTTLDRLLTMMYNVTTLALGSRPRQGVARLRAKWETREHSTCSRECKECEGMSPHTPK